MKTYKYKYIVIKHINKTDLPSPSNSYPHTDRNLKWDTAEFSQDIAGSYQDPTSSVRSSCSYFNDVHCSIILELIYMQICLGRLHLLSHQKICPPINRIIVKHSPAYKLK